MDEKKEESNERFKGVVLVHLNYKARWDNDGKEEDSWSKGELTV